MITRTASFVVCLALASCSDVETTPKSGDSEAASNTPTSGTGTQQALTVERAKTVLENIDSRLQFVRQEAGLAGLPETSILYAKLEEEGVKTNVNIGLRGQEARFTHLKIVLETQVEGGPFIPERFIAKYVAAFVRKALDDGDARWTELLEQPDPLGVESQTCLIRQLKTERCFLMLVQRGDVNASQFQQIELNITTHEVQEELDSQLQHFMRGKK